MSEPPAGPRRRPTSTGSGSGGKRAARGGGKHGRFYRVVKWTLIAAIVLVIVACGSFFFAYQSTTIPSANAAFKAQTSFVYYNNGSTKIGSFATQNRVSVPLGEISESMQQAAVAAEDRTFWTNKGIDPKSILRAAFSNAQGNATQGASTITQQYVKVLYLTQERTLKRKIKEAFLSLKIQKEQSKRQILDGYLNTIYFGRGAYGVQAAADAWFGVDAKSLNLRQSAMLAAILNSPNAYNPDNGQHAQELLSERYRYVLDGMVKAGNITQEQADQAGRRLPARIKRHVDVFGGQKGFMMSLVKQELEEKGFTEEQIDGGGLRVTTTLTRPAMSAAREAVAEVAPTGLKGLHVGVASVDTHTGALLGFYGGQNYLNSQLNWATAADSPGSTMKPFALAAALKAHWNLKSTFDGNAPLVINDLKVNNESDAAGQPTDYGQNVTLLEGLEKSINTVYVDMTNRTPDGPQKIKDTAAAMGLPAKSLTANTTIALGSDPVSPVELADGYATIANGGTYHPWYVVKKVVSSATGKTLYQAHPAKSGKRAISSDIADDVSYAMQQVASVGTGSAHASPGVMGRPVAGKTGTATDQAGDVITSWYGGFTPQVSTAVMYARDNGRKPLDGFLPSYFGADYPAETWAATMKSLMDGYDVEDFPPAAWVTGTPPEPGHTYVPPPPPPPTKPAKKKTKPTHTPSPTKPTTKPTTPAPPSNPTNPAPSDQPSDKTPGTSGE